MAAREPTTTDDEVRALLKRVRLVELRTRKTVNAAGQGAYHSRFKGRGMAFSESRAYAPGDDPRHIDWNATARRLHEESADGAGLFVKQFVEERELTLILAVDLSGSMSAGTRQKKRQVAAEAAALLAFSALRNNDKVGLLLFTDQVELLVRPKKGRAHVLRCVREVLATRPAGKGTDLAAACEVATHLSKQRAIVALVTDLAETRADGLRAGPLARAAQGAASLGATERPLKVLARRHDLLVVEVEDALDLELPDAGLVAVVDPETGRRALVDTGAAPVRAAYRERMKAERLRVRAALDRLGVDRVVVSERESSAALVRFLRRRKRVAA
ncbi:MAG: hypothetical protein A2138_22905 [Deltaproteobacteria bacterium RBG_16_71_12]|nr:MAG: hypothetical protein A2138_22905 [Deltaproteobacteria bacterium RBG_16_71_12]